MQHTILGMMKSPPEVVEKHFAIKKHESLAQCREWERLSTHVKPLPSEVLEAVATAEATFANPNRYYYQNSASNSRAPNGGGITGWISSSLTSFLGSGGTQQPAQPPIQPPVQPVSQSDWNAYYRASSLKHQHEQATK